MLNRRAWVYLNCTPRMGDSQGKPIPETGGSNHQRTGTGGSTSKLSTALAAPWQLVVLSRSRQTFTVPLGCEAGLVAPGPKLSVPEMPDSSEDHCHSMTLGRFDDLLIAHRTARLDDRRGPSL